MRNLPQLEWYDHELGFFVAKTAVGTFTAYKDELKYSSPSMPTTYTQHEEPTDYKLEAQKYFVEECLGLEIDKEYPQEIVDLAIILSKELDCSGDEWCSVLSTYTYNTEGISKIVYVENVGGADDKALIVMLHSEDVNIPVDNVYAAQERVELSIAQRIIARITELKIIDEHIESLRAKNTFVRNYPPPTAC